MSDEAQPLKIVLSQRNICGFKKHIFLCAGPRCCQESLGEEVWQYLKTRLIELKLVDHAIYRTKAACLRICQQGPVALIYPDGIWYRLVNKEVCEQIIQEHLINHRPLQENIIAENPIT